MPERRSHALAGVVLHGDAVGDPDIPNQQRDREQAIADLQAGGHFAPLGLTGPFILHLSLEGGRLVLDLRDAQGRGLRAYVLALSPFRRLIKDYRLLVESHEAAVADAHASRVQTIDMGRRALHNEGAALMIERLHGKIEIDSETARRLFTLLCVLHRRI